MIWGITLEPGQAHTEVIEDEVHLSMATMESRGCIGSKADNFSHVVIKTGTTEYLLCTLVNGITYQQCLDLKLMPSDKVTFSVQGTNVVYLTGYSFASSETDQEITQTEDWIEDPVLEEDIPQDNLEYSEGDSNFQSSMVHDEMQRQQQNTGGDEEDQEQFSVQYEVPAVAEQQYQYAPESGHQQITHGAPSTSSQGQPQQHPSHDTDGSSLDIKEEIHTVVDTEEAVPTHQGNEDISSQSGHQAIHQPSTSAGSLLSKQWKKQYSSVTMTTNTTRLQELGHKPGDGSGIQMQPPVTAAPQYIHIPSSQRHGIVPRTMRYSSDEKSNTCKFCGKWFFTRYATRTHEKIHTGERAFSCKFCGKRFIQSGQRNQHELTHTGERPHKCSYCGKGFQRLTHKRRHEQIHTERPNAKSQKRFPIKFTNPPEQTNDPESQICASTQEIYYKEIPTSQPMDVKAETSEEVVIAEIETPKTEA